MTLGSRVHGVAVNGQFVIKFMPKPGQRFNRLTIIEEVERNAHNKRRFRCRCDCGTETIVEGQQLTKRNRPTRSCGCLMRECASKIISGNKWRLSHGDARKRDEASEYRSWNAMIARCENPKAHNYEYYGGRGIKVCERWRSSYPNFLADMGRKPSPDHSLDRYPNKDGDYEPDNCRWATRKEQANNQRGRKR